MVVWRSLSLRARINCLIGFILALGLAANVARLVLEAGPRIQAEDRSVIRLTREVIESIGPSVNAAPDADARLDALVADLNRLRHVSIARSDADHTLPQLQGREKPGDGAGTAPFWFAALIHPERISVAVPVVIGGRAQTLVITSHPDDEMQEIWDDIVTQLALGIIVAMVLFVVTSLVVKRALAPLDSLTRAMMDIEAGRYGSHVVPSGAPELAALCERGNHLASTLGAAVEDRRKLAERMVSLQDLERKDLARELHDEFGPHLFALRAHAGAVSRLADRDLQQLSSLSKHATAILVQIDVLQQFNRRILERLRPVGLLDLGLPGAVEVLIRLWREANPGVAIESRISPDLGRVSDAAELTAYRVVQEGLTNTFRHARATRVGVTIDRVSPGSQGSDRAHMIVRIRDNGIGIDPERHSGFGLIGMRERVWALGGELTVISQADGVVIEAIIPADGHVTARIAEGDRECSPALSGD